MSKKNIKVQHPELTKTFFGAIDTSLFFTYALAQFFTGAIGDMYPQRLVLSISFTIQAVLFFFVGVGGSYEIFHLWWFGSLFALIGLI
jgi:sugar phosphate permease